MKAVGTAGREGLTKRGRALAEGIWKKGLDWLYPRCCPFCHEILSDPRQQICAGCLENIRPVKEPRCKKCGKPLRDAEAERCGDCAGHSHFFTEGAGIFPYDEFAHASMMKYKFQNRREYGRFFGRALCVYGEPFLKRWNPQLILPVPMHPADRRRRGFSQGEDLAKAVGEAYSIPVAYHLMEKTKRTAGQKKLDRRERKKNLRGAFSGREGRWPVDRVLIVDDVYTTGSTIDALAREIAVHGVSEIYFLCVFIGGPA